jgi:hypothetical protein
LAYSPCGVEDVIANSDRQKKLIRRLPFPVPAHHPVLVRTDARAHDPDSSLTLASELDHIPDTPTDQALYLLTLSSLHSPLIQTHHALLLKYVFSSLCEVGGY